MRLLSFPFEQFAERVPMLLVARDEEDVGGLGHGEVGLNGLSDLPRGARTI
jgi:hypothetical protein